MHPRRSLPLASRLLRLLAISALIGFCWQSSAHGLEASSALGDQLIAAAQTGDLETVKRLLESGVDVDSTNRYGATALFFATDKGHAEMVTLLLERGANVNLTDTFYNAGPMDWALSKVEDSPVHREIILELLAKKPENTTQVLSFAARSGDSEIAELVLGLEQASPAELKAAASAAEEAGHTALAERLTATAQNAPDEETLSVAKDVLESYTGEFKNEEMALVAKVFLEEDDFKVQLEGQPALTLNATAERRFTAIEAAGVAIEFNGRGGIVEGMTVTQGDHEFVFPKVVAEPAEPVVEAKAAPLEPVTREAARPWPAFRGPAGSGNGDGQGAPALWDGASGENVLWKTPVPGIALSSPIIWDDRVYVTTAISKGEDETFRIGLYGDVESVEDDSTHLWKVYALDRTSGEVLWERTAAEGIPKVKRHTKSSHANPTPVTDGKHIVAHFGSEGIFCYDTTGKLLWHQKVEKLVSGWFYDPTYEWGFSSSPILHDGLVIVQTDIQEGSNIAAYDVVTGEERWRTERDEIPTWGTPNVLLTKEGAEIVTNGTTIRGYDAATGSELWTLGPNSEVTVGSPIVSDGVAYVTGGYPPVRPIYAIRPGGRGDLTLSEGETSSESIVWSTTRGGTYIPTPIIYEDILYMTHNNGRLTAHDTATGEQLYRARVGTSDSFAGSPVAADGRLYFTNEEGRTYVVRSGPVYEELGRNELGEIVMTTPAISDGMMIVRGMNHVWALSEPKSTESAQGDR